jgi:hypothetical protein
MKKDIRYICEYCGTAFESEADCAKCEEKHAVPKIIKPLYSKGERYAHKVVILYENGTRDEFVSM